MPTAWRVVLGKYTTLPHDPFDGAGASRWGGRWNSPGVPVVYAASSISLAVLETLVHAEFLKALAGDEDGVVRL